MVTILNAASLAAWDTGDDHVIASAAAGLKRDEGRRIKLTPAFITSLFRKYQHQYSVSDTVRPAPAAPHPAPLLFPMP